MITKKATLGALLSKGYFPRELPPAFNTTSYASYARRAGTSWPKDLWTRCAKHSLARPGGLRRPLKIPNPVSYFNLAQILATNWETIRSHTWKQSLSTSRPYVLKQCTRAVVPRYHLKELSRIRVLRRRANYYLLRTDINQFYPTVYTHAIPWALHTKAASKARLKGGRTALIPLGDRIDKALRCMNEGQTLGIPIGPDSSLVVAEILLSAIDDMLCTSRGAGFSGFRHVDDYELSFQSLGAAEETLAELQELLASFELSLNPKKTSIVPLPQELSSAWAVELKSLPLRSRDTPVAQRNDILDFFSRAFELATHQPSDSILRYAVAHVQNLDVSSSAWRTFHNCLFSAMSADPSILPVALGTLHQVAQLGDHAVPKGPLSEVLAGIISRQVVKSSELAWAIWGALVWNVQLSTSAAQVIDKIEDDIVALLAMHADENQLFPRGSLSRSLWVGLAAQADALQGEHWLLAYEANQQGWLPCSAVSKDSTFAAMSNAGVSFYDVAGIEAQFPEAGRGAPGGTLWDSYA
jgi:hypothetical protein